MPRADVSPKDFDNRDDHETWISTTISLDPYEVFLNMLENNVAEGKEREVDRVWKTICEHVDYLIKD